MSERAYLIAKAFPSALRGVDRLGAIAMGGEAQMRQAKRSAGRRAAKYIARSRSIGQMYRTGTVRGKMVAVKAPSPAKDNLDSLARMHVEGGQFQRQGLDEVRQSHERLQMYDRSQAFKYRRQGKDWREINPKTRSLP